MLVNGLVLPYERLDVERKFRRSVGGCIPVLEGGLFTWTFVLKDRAGDGMPLLKGGADMCILPFIGCLCEECGVVGMLKAV